MSLPMPGLELMGYLAAACTTLSFVMKDGVVYRAPQR